MSGLSLSIGIPLLKKSLTDMIGLKVMETTHCGLGGSGGCNSWRYGCAFACSFAACAIAILM